MPGHVRRLRTDLRKLPNFEARGRGENWSDAESPSFPKIPHSRGERAAHLDRAARAREPAAVCEAGGIVMRGRSPYAWAMSAVCGSRFARPIERVALSEEDEYPPEEEVDDLDESTPADEEASPDADASPVPARSESSEHTHPQLAEIEQRMAWFLDHPEFDLCVVVEPESQSIVRIRIPLKTKRGFRSPRYGRELDVELTPDETVREQVLYDLGFESFGERKGNVRRRAERGLPAVHQARHPREAGGHRHPQRDAGRLPDRRRVALDIPRGRPGPVARPVAEAEGVAAGEVTASRIRDWSMRCGPVTNVDELRFANVVGVG